MAQAAEVGNPVNVLSAGTSEDKGERAKLANIVGATAVADLVRTTLGPKGMDKIIHSMSRNDVMVTNDGATILKSIHIDNAAAKILIDISKTQDAEVGDGTTSVCVLAGEMLRESEKLLQQKVHPQTIVEGFRMAVDVAIAALEAHAEDNSSDKAKFREDLLNIARTTLSSKVLTNEKEHFAELAVRAVERLNGSTNLENIVLIKKAGGTLRDSFLDDGFILDKRFGVGQPKVLTDVKVMVANTPMDTDKIKIYGARVRTNSYERLAEIEAAEKSRMEEKCRAILSHGPNLFINRQLIYNHPEQLLFENGCATIEHADFEGVERLALALGAEIVSTFGEGAQVKLGHADRVEEIMIGEDRLIRFSGLSAAEACSIVLRGASQHVLDEADRSLHDALAVLSQTTQETRTVLGGGCAESIMARAVEEESKKTGGKKQLAMQAFADALRKIPTIIADNAGLDSADLVSRLTSEHYKGNATAGLDIRAGRVGDVKALGITESFKVKRHVVIAAEEAAEMILRVDDIIQAAPRQRQGM
nr:T-complex protein 1 subunit beta [Seculamonas ecuadoriensis]